MKRNRYYPTRYVDRYWSLDVTTIYKIDTFFVSNHPFCCKWNCFSITFRSIKLYWIWETSSVLELLIFLPPPGSWNGLKEQNIILILQSWALVLENFSRLSISPFTPSSVFLRNKTYTLHCGFPFLWIPVEHQLLLLLLFQRTLFLFLFCIESVRFYKTRSKNFAVTSFACNETWTTTIISALSNPCGFGFSQDISLPYLQ